MDQYLTPKLKDYYMADFESHVLTCELDSWKLDKGTREVLIAINQNRNIQTLYSKRHSNDRGQSNSGKSYIKFAYAKEVEQKLFKEVIPTIVNSNNEPLLRKANCYHRFSYPRDNTNIREREGDKCKMECMIGEDYFRINHFGLHLHSFEVGRHDQFWEQIKKELATID